MARPAVVVKVESVERVPASNPQVKGVVKQAGPEPLKSEQQVSSAAWASPVRRV
jgi:hypothetical protein